MSKLSARISLETERDHEKWSTYNADLLRSFFTTDDLAKEYEWCAVAGEVHFVFGEASVAPRDLRADMEARLSCLESIVERLEIFQAPVPQGSARAGVTPQTLRTPIEKLEQLANRFHLVAQQLLLRHGDRETLKIKDEYDVQDLLHALLKLEFEDVRPDEHTPSYAGSFIIIS